MASSRLMVPSRMPLILWQPAITRRSHWTRPSRVNVSSRLSEQVSHRLFPASQASRGITGRAVRRFSRAAVIEARMDDGLSGLWRRYSMTSSSTAPAGLPSTSRPVTEPVASRGWPPSLASG